MTFNFNKIILLIIKNLPCVEDFVEIAGLSIEGDKELELALK